MWPLFEREVADVHRGLFPEHADSYGDDVRGRLEDDFAVSDAEVAAAERARAEYRERLAEALDEVDLLVTPTVQRVAPRIDELPELADADWATRFTFPFNVVGRPALALPCGAAEHGLPASVQLVGRSGDDARVLAAGRLLEQALSHPSIE